jgi:hypothetical protein
VAVAEDHCHAGSRPGAHGVVHVGRELDHEDAIKDEDKEGNDRLKGKGPERCQE